MNRKSSSLPSRPSILVEVLEPRIAPAGLLNETKFTSVVVGGSVLLDASGGPNDFQGLSTGFGAYSGTYLLYLVTGKALVYTTDLNGDGLFEPGEITGISLGVDSLGRAPSLILFSDVHGDIVTNLLSGEGNHSLTDSDSNAANGRDGRVLLSTDIGSITLRTITAADIDTSIPGNTVSDRLGLTSFSIYGNIFCGGDFGGLTIDTSGAMALATKFNGSVGIQLYQGSTPQVGSIETGTAAAGQTFHFTQQASNNIGGVIQPFMPADGQHGGDISNITAVDVSTSYSIGELATGNGGAGARGGNISNVVLHGDTGSYELIAGDGGSGASGGQGGSIINFNDLDTLTGQVILHTGAGGTGTLNGGGAGGTATFATTNIAAGVEVFLGRGGDGFTMGGAGSGLAAAVFTSPEGMFPIGSKVVGTWHDLGDVGNTHPNADGTYSPEVINFNAPSFFSDPVLASTVGDLYGDAVFSTSVPGQIEVVFGNGAGGLNDNGGAFNISNSETVFLHVPGIVNPVFTVGDFNGDGRPDIAVASGDPNNFSGIYVFLDQIGTANDPINSHNFSQNPLGDHPFSNALQSATPSLTSFANTTGIIPEVFTGPGAIFGLTSGDFNGDGITDIALVQQVTTIVAGLGPKEEVTEILFGTAAHDLNGNAITNTINGQPRNAATGFFYSNSADPTETETLQIQQTTLSSSANVVLKATSLTSNNAPGTGTTPGSLAVPEVYGYGVIGEKQLFEMFVAVGSTTTHKPALAGLQAQEVDFGKVDTDRTLGPTHISSTDATLQDFAFVDIDNSGTADISVLTKAPQEFLVTFAGLGAFPTLIDFTFVGPTTNFGGYIKGAFVPDMAASFDPTGSADNAGIYLSATGGTPPPANALTAVDADGTGPDGVPQFNDFAYTSFPNTSTDPVVVEATLTGNNADHTIFYSGGQPTYGRLLFTGAVVADQTIAGLDAFYVDVPTPANAHPLPGYVLISPNSTQIQFADLFILTDTIYFRSLTENGYLLAAGAGGNAVSGTGGAGGTLGTPTLTAVDASGDVAGALQIIFPSNIDYSGATVLEAGNGGYGFAGGGNGGGIEGFTVRYAPGTTVLTSNAAAIAGNGGNSGAGPGGAGGNIDTASVETGVFFIAGNGGNGSTGGVGGNIVGNKTGTIFDTSSGSTVLTADQAAKVGLISLADAQAIDAGAPPPETFGLSGVGLGTGVGGQGTVVGGSGGSITSWDSVFNNIIGGGVGAGGDSLYYATGAGGSAASGIGGTGGSITNSSPNTGQNNLSDVLHLQTGAGGSGLTGGDGGAITTFVNQPTEQTAVASQLSVVTGGGGTGVSGTGGAGGAITGFQSNASGLFDGTLVGIGRVIAGDGGASFGGVGGAGGAITSITAQTTSAPIVVAGGAGGDGLTVGGNGGSVTNSVINSAAQQIGKVLIVAGAGGNSLSALPTDITLSGDTNTADLAHAVLAFGGASPHGGDGGDVTGITQPISTQTAVDIIAGNGGSTFNAGTSLDAASGVGRGGSVVDISLTGTVGAVSRNTTLGEIVNPPIQAYATTDDSGVVNTPASISSIVDSLALPDTQYFTLNDSVSTATSFDGLGNVSGNVGIVAGAAGRVRNDQPAQDALNGSAQNITAGSVMSIVAGSVSRVAPVNILSNIVVTDPDGVLGVDRSTVPITLSNGQLSYPPNGQLDYFTNNLSGVDVTNSPIQAGYSLVQQQVNADGTVVPVTGGDGALYAITIQQTAGSTLEGPRIFTILGNT